jgi:hypothetical protein
MLEFESELMKECVWVSDSESPLVSEMECLSDCWSGCLSRSTSDFVLGSQLEC